MGDRSAFLQVVKQKDPGHDVGVGNIFVFETEHSGTAKLVDVIVFHDYSATRKRLREMLDMAIALGKKYGKPVLDNEMCCLCRANPYEMSIELHNEHKIGWYLFELMIGNDAWSRVHGVVYPNGTVRDPSIVSAIYGFYRNRSEMAIRSDVNQEDYVKRAMILAERTLRSTRQNQHDSYARKKEKLLEACEYAANQLEAGELVPMAYPPTAKIEAYRNDGRVDLQELADYLTDLLAALKSACHIIK